jgi:hypothetical protein
VILKTTALVFIGEGFCERAISVIVGPTGGDNFAM